MSRTSPTGCSKLILPDLEKIAIATKLIIRKSSKFSAEGFLTSLLFAASSGQGSLNQIVQNLKNRVIQAMARQSLFERFSPKSTAFLCGVLQDLMEQRYQPVRSAFSNSKIRRIIVEDASAQVLPKSNAKNFPAHGNHHGKTAGVKIDFAYDLLSGTMVSHTLELATTQDKTIGKEIIPNVLPGDLVLRDMGYFILDEFTAIERLGANWLTRLPLTTGVILEYETTLEKKLSQTKEKTLDLTVLVGEQKKKCRLVAVRASPEIAEKRRRERRQKAAQNGKQACPKGLARDGWHLMLTNLNQEEATVAQLAEVYRARWAVEIQFRAWKQALNLTEALNRKSNEHHIQALVLAGMIAHQLGMALAQLLVTQVGRSRLSFEKLYDSLAQSLLRIDSLSELLDFSPDPRHIKRDKRKRKSPIETGITALT